MITDDLYAFVLAQADDAFEEMRHANPSDNGYYLALGEYKTWKRVQFKIMSLTTQEVIHAVEKNSAELDEASMRRCAVCEQQPSDGGTADHDADRADRASGGSAGIPLGDVA